MTFIADLKDGQRVIDLFLCKEKQQLITKAGKDYLKLQLEDKTGCIGAMVWDLSDQIGSFEKGDIIKIDTHLEDELDVYVGNIKKFSAIPGAYNDSYAVKIKSIYREE